MLNIRENLFLKARLKIFLAAVLGKEILVTKSGFRYYFFMNASPAVRYNYRGKAWKKNMIVDVGKDSILKRLANLTGGGYAYQIGVSDNLTGVTNLDTDLGGANNQWKTIVVPDGITYVRPTAFFQVTFGYSEAVWTWNRLGIRDNNNVAWAFQLDNAPITKSNVESAIAEWQLSL